MKRYYIAHFDQVIQDEDGVSRPVLPWDGLGVSVRYIAAPDGAGGYAKNWVFAVVGGAKHPDIAKKKEAFQLPEVTQSLRFGVLPPSESMRMKNKLAELGLATTDVNDNFKWGDVLRRIGQAIKPGFDPTGFDLTDEI